MRYHLVIDPETPACPDIPTALGLLRQAMAADDRCDVLVELAPGFHRLDSTAVLDRAHLPADSYACRWRSLDPERPAVIRSSVPVVDWQPLSTLADAPDVPDQVRWARMPKREGPLTEPWRPRSLFTADGRRLPMARSPVFNMRPVSGLGAGYDPLRQVFVPSDLLVGTSSVDNLILSCLAHQKWMHHRIELEEADLETGLVRTSVLSTYVLDEIGWGWFPDGHAWIENNPTAIDGPDQWAIDHARGIVYLWPEEGVDLDAHPPRLPTVVEQVRVEGEIDEAAASDRCVDRVAFEGLTFTENDWFHWRADRIGRGLQHDWEMFDAATAALRFRGASRCVVRGCRFASLAGSAVRLDLACDRHELSHNRFEHVGGTAIVAAGYGAGTKDANHHHSIIDNDIAFVGESYWHAPAIFLWQSGHNEVRGNRISCCPYTGIVIAGRFSYERSLHGDGVEPPQCHRTIRWDEIDSAVTDGCHRDWGTWYLRERYQHARHNVIADNDIAQVMLMTGDGNGIYLSGAGGGNRVERNLIRDNDSLTMNAAIRADDDQYHVDIVGNVIHRSLGEGIMVKGLCLVADNLIVDLRQRHSNGRVTDYIRGALVAPQAWARGSQFRRNVVISTVSDQLVGSFRDDAQLSGLIMGDNAYHNLVQEDWAQEHLRSAQALGCETGSTTAVLDFAGPDGQMIDHAVARTALAGLGIDPYRTALAWMEAGHNRPVAAPVMRPFWPVLVVKRDDSTILATE